MNENESKIILIFPAERISLQTSPSKYMMVDLSLYLYWRRTPTLFNLALKWLYVMSGF